jgi:poly(3-hydroxybutyrate) depolymerase
MSRPRIVSLLALLGCSSSGSRPALDGGEPDAREPFVPPVAAYVDPEPLPVAEWRLATVSGFDPVLPALYDGSFTYPDLGMANGVYWQAVTPGDAGSLGNWSGQYVYAVARVTFDAPTRLVARTERTLQVFVNGVPQPGDIYGSGRMRVPLLASAGENLIVLRGLGNRGDLQAELWTTPDELFMNLADLTAPDLVAGDASELFLGVPVLDLVAEAAPRVTARVVENDQFFATDVALPSLSGGAVTQLSFRLLPKRPYPAAGQRVPVTVHVEAESLSFAYEREIDLPTVAGDAAYHRTFLSSDDGSTQYYAVLPPAGFDPTHDYALILSLHGAGVDAIGQAQSYSKKDWAFVVAPTNRRPFGFDWEEWGRADAILALDDAMAHFPIDPSRVYLTGHSMGGHGTWHVGVMHPGRFAVIGPSAGWGSFYSYTGATRPAYPFSRSQAHSDTTVYLPNLAWRGVYVLHGGADDNVPVTEGQTMSALAAMYSDDVVYFEQPGAGHWWDGDASPGVDCVDWPPMMEMMRTRRLDPYELDFEFVSPSPAYSAEHSFVTLESAQTPFDNLAIASRRSGSTVTLTTTNVRSFRIDGAALLARGVDEVVVDGDSRPVPDGPLWIGPATGKNRGVYGTYNQVFHRPYCYVYPDGADAYARYASFLVSYWAVIGNGQACALPASRLTQEVRNRENLVYLGFPSADIGAPDVPFAWDDAGIRVGEMSYSDAGLLFVFPDRDRLAALVAATAGAEAALYSIIPFSSRSGLPDYYVWSGGGGLAAGFFDSEWRYDAALGVP